MRRRQYIQLRAIGMHLKGSAAYFGDERTRVGVLGGLDVVHPEGDVVFEFAQGAFEDLELAAEEGEVGDGGGGCWDLCWVC